MIVEVARRSLIGLGYTAIITFSILTAMMFQDVQVPISEIWRNTLGGMAMGIYFGGASLIFEIEEWSPLKKTAFHYLISIIIWLPLGIWMGWLPLQLVPILIGIGTFSVVYLLFWYGSYLYFKRMENEMNHSVKK
ncbi:DUF3021 domain-containing protein [Sporosarcina sp. FSL W7-1349]|uniref:DUF3021 domain-containing protein n=1 Tax=Sporosarcina sp. FSL W7-1349 TaxID=2921561 RepID=UPI0030F72346